VFVVVTIVDALSYQLTFHASCFTHNRVSYASYLHSLSDVMNPDDARPVGDAYGHCSACAYHALLWWGKLSTSLTCEDSAYEALT